MLLHAKKDCTLFTQSCYLKADVLLGLEISVSSTLCSVDLNLVS